MRNIKLENFKRLVCMNQKELKEYMYALLVDYYGTKNVFSEDGFIFAKGELPVTLVAHLDTVHEVQVCEDDIDVDDNIISSPVGIGGDDRCGVYIIEKLVRQGLKPTIVLTEDEEIGCVGARKFASNQRYVSKLKRTHFIIELDRKGENDAVFYDCDNEEFKRFVLRSGQGWKEATGTCSDICYIAPAANRAAVNLSVGYYNAHTKEEYVDIHMLDFISIKIHNFIYNQTINDKTYKYDDMNDEE